MTVEEIGRRIEKAEEDIKNLYSRTNKFSEEMAAVTTKLDNILLTLGELKESVCRLNAKPMKYLEKFIFGFIGAVAASLAAAVIAAII